MGLGQHFDFSNILLRKPRIGANVIRKIRDCTLVFEANLKPPSLQVIRRARQSGSFVF